MHRTASGIGYRASYHEVILLHVPVHAACPGPAEGEHVPPKVIQVRRLILVQSEVVIHAPGCRFQGLVVDVLPNPACIRLRTKGLGSLSSPLWRDKLSVIVIVGVV